MSASSPGKYLTHASSTIGVRPFAIAARFSALRISPYPDSSHVLRSCRQSAAFDRFTPRRVVPGTRVGVAVSPIDPAAPLLGATTSLTGAASAACDPPATARGIGRGGGNAPSA